ncbi:hypothetical protein OIU85_004458 [Salix viminalis]|uniref:Methyltransferase type 11 domain-containing protein n=1 Tax=Salix viminalis TaxID=40686 RepID=A0A9Q0PSK7_SALVM|nr:hypothetical protein OIU85_004458 [Salix viminalis]
MWTAERDLDQLKQFIKDPFDGYEVIRIVGKNPFLWHDHWPVKDEARVFECLVLIEEIAKEADRVVSKIREVGKEISSSKIGPAQSDFESGSSLLEAVPCVAVHMRIEIDWMIHCKKLERKLNVSEICSGKQEIMEGVGNKSTSQPQIFHNIRTSQPISHLHLFRTACLAPLPCRSRLIRCAASTTAADSGSTRELKQGIAELYDQSSAVWEDIWGDHMHHGFYDPDEVAPGSGPDHRAAQFRMIQEALCFAGVSEDPEKGPKTVVDVGCGIGGSSRYIARKYGAKCQGITLSPFQAQRANALAATEGLADKVSFQVADALEQPFPDGQFDLVWSMESGEHMPDKRKFVGELARVAAPGATIVIVTWCHRVLGPSEESLQPWEIKHLKKICDAYYLPDWCSTADYVNLLESLSLQDIKTADWSQYVAPFWPAVIRSALTWKGLTSLLRSGMKTIRGALVMPLMIEGYRKGLIKFAIITCRKPE